MPLETLRLIEERKLHTLLPGCDKDTDLEASGVIQIDDSYLVAFDNLSQLGRLFDLSPENTNRNSFVGKKKGDGGYESLARDADRRQYYLLVEALKRKKGVYQSKLVEWDRDFVYKTEQWLDFDLDDENKGFEGLAHLRRENDCYLLVICHILI